MFGHAPGTQGHENCHDDGKFLGNDGHGQGQSSQHTVEQLSPCQYIDHDDHEAEADAHQCQLFHQGIQFQFQPRGRRFDGTQGHTDASHFGGHTYPVDFKHAVALHHQGAGKNVGRVIAAHRVARDSIGILIALPFPHGH